MRLIIKSIFFSLILTSTAHAGKFKERLLLKGGLGATAAKIETLSSKDDGLAGIAFHTKFGYRKKKWEFLLASYVFLGPVDGLQFFARNNTIEAEDGVLRSVSYGPLITYYTDIQIKKKYNLYVGFGPTWSLQTIDLTKYEATDGNIIDVNDKITLESGGAHLIIGMEEQGISKDKHPVYYELVYTYLKTRQVNIVDFSNRIKVETISSEQIRRNIQFHIIQLNIGMSIF
jgi:hypothetical protein